MVAELIEAEVPESAARELIEQLRAVTRDDHDLTSLRTGLIQMLDQELPAGGPIAPLSG